MYLIGYKLSSSRFWCLLYKTEKWGGMCRIGTEFFVYVFFCGWGRFPPRPSRARPTPSAGSPPQRPLPHVIPAKAGTSFFSSKGAVLQNVMLTKVSIGCRTASCNNVCFEWHFARKHDHFVEVFALRNASSPQRNTRWALLGAVTAGYVCSAVTAPPS